jgi:hypothetical protein
MVHRSPLNLSAEGVIDHHSSEDFRIAEFGGNKPSRATDLLVADDGRLGFVQVLPGFFGIRSTDYKMTRIARALAGDENDDFITRLRAGYGADLIFIDNQPPDTKEFSHESSPFTFECFWGLSPRPDLHRLPWGDPHHLHKRDLIPFSNFVQGLRV